MRNLLRLILVFCMLGLAQGCCCDRRYARCCGTQATCQSSMRKQWQAGEHSFCKPDKRRHRDKDDDDDDDEDAAGDDCCCGCDTGLAGQACGACGCCGMQTGVWGGAMAASAYSGIPGTPWVVSPGNCASCAGAMPATAGCAGGMPAESSCAGSCAAPGIPSGTCAAGTCATGITEGMVIDGASGWTLSAPSPSLVEPIPAPPAGPEVAPAPPPAPAPPVPGTASSRK